MYKNKKKNYPLYQPRNIKDLRDLIDGAAARYGDKPVYIYREKGAEKSVSYKEFKKQVDSLGTALCNMDLKKAHIAIIGENSYGWVLSYLTVLNTSLPSPSSNMAMVVPKALLVPNINPPKPNILVTSDGSGAS